MKAHIVEQDFQVTYKVRLARISSLGAKSDTEEQINVAFYATHWVTKETQEIEGEVQEVEVIKPLNSPVILDESQHVIPYELWVGLRKCISTPEILPTINEALEPFNALFTNSMQGFDLEISSIEMG